MWNWNKDMCLPSLTSLWTTRDKSWHCRVPYSTDWSASRPKTSYQQELRPFHSSHVGYITAEPFKAISHYSVTTRYRTTCYRLQSKTLTYLLKRLTPTTTFQIPHVCHGEFTGIWAILSCPNGLSCRLKPVTNKCLCNLNWKWYDTGDQLATSPYYYVQNWHLYSYIT